MSVEALSPIDPTDQTPVNDAPPVDGGEVAIDEDTALSQAFDDAQGINTEESVGEGRTRDESGRFVSGQKDPVEGKEGETQEAVEPPSTPAEESAPLPNFLNGLDDDVIAAIPDNVRDAVVARSTEWERRQSDLGRRVSSSEPIAQAVDQFKSQYEGLTHPDTNQPVTSVQAVEYLFNAQRAMNQDPLNSILQFADEFGVSEQLYQVLGGYANGETAPEGANQATLLQKIAGLEGHIAQLSDPAALDGRINQVVEQRSSEQEVNNAISRFTETNPLFAEIPSETLVHTINTAKAELGEGATNDQILASAYDMSVHMIPSLRAKVAAAIPAPADNGKRVRDQKAANSVNVKSTSTGKAREPTEEESLAAAYDNAQKKG